MTRLADRILLALGIDPRGFWALTKTFLLMDLRGQHYARATGTQTRELISPLFWVVGQCLTISATASLVLFVRVDVFFYAFTSLTLSLLLMAATVLVEFQEVVLDPRDLEIIGHRPVAPRTYAAARFANLLFYLVLMYLALNLLPLIVGAGLRDAGPWYAPAYLIASLAGNLAVVTLVIVLLSFARPGGRFEEWKALLAWTQIVVLFVVFYGGQLALRDHDHALQLWGAFPPTWIAYLPSTWLARFVEEAAQGGGPRTSLMGALLATGTVVCGVMIVWRLAGLYRTMQPVTPAARRRPMVPGQVGGLAGRLSGWVARTPEERAGFWLCRTFLWRDGDLKMRCLWPACSALAAVVLGVGSGQFGNPLEETDPRRVTLPILAVYLLALAIPPIVYNLCFHRDSEAAWLLGGAPLRQPAGVARGACKAVLLGVVTPLCVLFGLTALLVWRDPLAAALHAGLAWALSWPLALAALWFVVPAGPFSRPLARGSTLGPVALPLAGLSAIVLGASGLHFLWAPSPFFWIGAGLVCLSATVVCGRLADARFRRLARG